MKLYRFVPEDKHDCLRLFDSNTPPFFAAEERRKFDEFLDGQSPPYFYFVVRESTEEIIACGGIKVEPENGLAMLRWDIVTRERHGQGVGAFLTKSRLYLICQLPEIQRVELGTSQYAQKFYKKMGFSSLQITKNGIMPGLDEYTMTMAIDESRRKEIRGTSAAVTELSLLRL
jgi:predicted GNAT family N-acyltransferase